MFEKEKLLTAVLPVRQRPPEKNTRHIVYAADQNYIRHIGTSMLSVLENNHFPIHFHLLVSGSESYDFSIFNHLETINPNYAVTVYHLNTEYFTTLQTNGYFTIAMYYRMCIPAILGGISDTALQAKSCRLQRHRPLLQFRRITVQHPKLERFTNRQYITKQNRSRGKRQHPPIMPRPRHPQPYLYQ